MPASPDPDLALRLAKATADVYAEAAERLLAIVARRLAHGLDDDSWASHKLAEIIALRDQAVAVVERLEVLGPVTDAITRAWDRGQLDATADGIALEFGRTNTATVDGLIRDTVAQLESTHRQIMRSTVDAYRQVIAEVSAPQVLTGTVSRRQATQAALDRFANRGITGFVDRAGRNWELQSYAEMATRTAVGRAQVAGTLDRIEGSGNDLVIVSDAPQECEACRPWEGRVLSISGATPKGTRVGGFTVAGTVAQAQSAGLHHPNCRHRLGAFVPGLTERMTDTADPDGDRYRQEQRRLERGVRHWKRRAAVAMDEPTRKAADLRARTWQARLRQHVDQNDLKRQPQRERIGSAR